jgi:hypothetical protein
MSICGRYLIKFHPAYAAAHTPNGSDLFQLGRDHTQRATLRELRI